MQWQRLDLNTNPDEPEFHGDPGELIDAAGDLLALLARPSWMANAACLEYPEMSWFAGDGVRLDEPRAVCSACPVREGCLDYAMTLGTEVHGVWGGLSARERRHLRTSVA